MTKTKKLATKYKTPAIPPLPAIECGFNLEHPSHTYLSLYEKDIPRYTGREVSKVRYLIEHHGLAGSRLAEGVLTLTKAALGELRSINGSWQRDIKQSPACLRDWEFEDLCRHSHFSKRSVRSHRSGEFIMLHPADFAEMQAAAKRCVNSGDDTPALKEHEIIGWC